MNTLRRSRALGRGFDADIVLSLLLTIRDRPSTRDRSPCSLATAIARRGERVSDSQRSAQAEINGTSATFAHERQVPRAATTAAGLKTSVPRRQEELCPGPKNAPRA